MRKILLIAFVLALLCTPLALAAQVEFSFDEGAENRYAASVSATPLGCRFYAAAPFSRLTLSCPSYSDNIGSLTIALYPWAGGYADTVAGAPVASQTYVDFADNASLALDVDAAAGEYLVLLSDGVDGVGVWAFSDSATGTFLYVGGVEASGVFTMRVRYTEKPAYLYKMLDSTIDLSKPVTAPEPVVYPDDHPTVVRDAMPDTWAATDALGRELPTSADVGEPRADRFVGMFFWTWHSELALSNEAINLNELMKQYPEAVNDYEHEIWQKYASGSYHWDEPIYGVSGGTDKWVLRKQAEMLANAGVDVVIFDNTNGTMTWREGYLTLCEAFSEARAQGVLTPRISFLLPFSDGANTVTQLREIYQTIYRDGLYQDLWFYWDGKPLMMSHFESLDLSDPIEAEIANFFTFRPGEPRYNNTVKRGNDEWGWLATYPQTTYYRRGNIAEQTTVGAAQNWSQKRGLTAMNGENVFGRAYTSKGVDTRLNAACYGANFAEQFDYALTVDPQFIFVTGWNEWVASRFGTWNGVSNAFPDEFNDLYSRDLEPTKGDIGDCYYYQLVDYVRRYKGARALPEPSAPVTVELDAFDLWESVSPRYIAYEGNTFDRFAYGYGHTLYTDSSGRNDITLAKAARDDDNLYFYVECAEDITPYTDPAWMRLYLDVEGDPGPDWESFQYLVNREGATAATMSLERSLGGWTWQKIADIPYRVEGARLHLSIPRALLNLSGPFELAFKWTDNTQSDGDILDFYVSGDVAPGGRFKFRYVSE